MSKTVQMKKANRVISVDEAQAKGYLARGYDQIDGKGKVSKKATAGKNISAAEYGRVVTELEELKARTAVGTDITTNTAFQELQDKYDKLEKSYHAQENENKNYEKLKADYEELEAKAKDFAAKGKALQEENDKLKAKK